MDVPSHNLTVVAEKLMPSKSEEPATIQVMSVGRLMGLQILGPKPRVSITRNYGHPPVVSRNAIFNLEALIVD
jgi:hypothetical protein